VETIEGIVEVYTTIAGGGSRR